MMETALRLSLMVFDKVFKELETISKDSQKMTQKAFRSLLLTEEYLESDTESKRQRIHHVLDCYMKTMRADSKLDLPFQMLTKLQ